MQVVPTEASLHELERVVYELRESHELPKINCFRSLKHVLFAGFRLNTCNRWLFRLKKWLAAFYVLGIINAYSVPFLPARFSRVAAFFGLIELPALAVTIISLRYDMMLLIMATYEFWYLSCLNMAFSAATMMNYQDSRVLLIAPTSASVLVIAFQDANFRRLQFAIHTFVSVAVVQILVIVYINLRFVDQWHTVQVVRYGKHALTSDNIASNYLVFTTVLMLRNAYRKRRSLQHCRGAVVRCILYRCRVHLVLRNTPQVKRLLRPQEAQVTQLRMVPTNEVYDSDQSMLRSVVSTHRARQFFGASLRNRIGLHLIGAVGLALTIAALVVMPSDLRSNCQPVDDCGLKKQTILSGSCVIMTGCFYCVFLGLSQRQLLLKLLTSFDFMLLGANVTLAHVCICDAFAWTPTKCVALASSWMWFMWAITMDALTPDLRQAVGLHTFHLILVIVVLVLLVVLLVIEIVFLQAWGLQDQSLFQAVALGKTVNLHVLQIFFSCLISLLPMCLRLICRLCCATQGELIILQGAVEYEDMMLVQRQARKTRDQKPRQSVSSRSMVVFPRWFFRTRVHSAGPTNQFNHVK